MERFISKTTTQRKLSKQRIYKLEKMLLGCFSKVSHFLFTFCFSIKFLLLWFFKTAKFIKENHLQKDLDSFKHLKLELWTGTLKIHPDENFLQQLNSTPMFCRIKKLQFGTGTLYNAILRIARNFLETRDNIKRTWGKKWHQWKSGMF